MTALALGEVEGRPLSDQKLGTYFVLLVVAGNETTRHTITSGAAALAAFPGQCELLRSGRRIGRGQRTKRSDGRRRSISTGASQPAT
jgi:cytochrome P450